MPRYSIKPTCTLDRPWWSGHPFRAHRGRCRKWTMGVLFVVLCIVIGGYAYLTDSSRVRSMAQSYLSHLLGGRVEIGDATLTLFEGLRVDDVKVYVDPAADKPDSLLFSAQAFVVNYDPRELIRGRLDATEIIAQKPHVYLTLTQGGQKDQWNYQRLRKQTPVASPARTGNESFSLPEILLRNAVVEISEVSAARRMHVGSMDIDGQLTPVGDGRRYHFEMQSRGVSEGLGPYAGGVVSVNTGALTAHLRNVSFSDDIRSMFPTDVRDWWKRHDLAGRIESVDVSYVPARKGVPQKFSVETSVRNVMLAVHRDEWSSHGEIERWRRLRSAVAMLDGPYRLAGFARPIASGDDAAKTSSTVANPSRFNPIDVLVEMVDTAPLRLNEVTGRFLFNQDGIDVRNLLVRVGTGDPDHPRATNALWVRGHIGGYSPDAPLHLRIDSASPAGIYLPPHPRFVDSLPADVRNFYNGLKPHGTVHVQAQVDRRQPGAMVQVEAGIKIVNATVLFRQFPYSFRAVGGAISFGPDPVTGQNYVNVDNVLGRGMIGGPNENAEVTVNGRVGPIGPNLPDPAIDLHAVGLHVSAETAFLNAMPPDVHAAFKIFDAPGHGEFPKFKGDFRCIIHRNAGRRQRITFDTNVDIADAAGRIVGFPYPCQHVRGKLQVHDGYINILNVTMGAAGASQITVNGSVRWADETGRFIPLDMHLKVAASDVPINSDLLDALPPAQAASLRSLGVAGDVDCTGKIFTTIPVGWERMVKPGQKPHDPPIQLDLAIALRHGTIWPADGMFSTSNVAGWIHLTHDRLDILDLHGRRDQGVISASGTLFLTGVSPHMQLHVSARDITADRALYAMLPPEGRGAWDEVRPRGTVDADMDFQEPLGVQPVAALASAATSAGASAAPPRSFHAVLKPRALSVDVRTVPYPLMLTGGQIVITPGRAVLQNVVGRHDSAKLTINGEGTLTNQPVWTLSLAGENLAVDDTLRAAMPPVLRDMVNGLKLHGAIGFDLSKLAYRAPITPGGDPDVDATGALYLKDGRVDAGMPLTDMQGALRFAVKSRGGKLDGVTGSLALDSLRIGGHPVRDLKLDLLRVKDHNDLHIDKLRAKVAGGEMAGSVVLTIPDSGANRYSMNLVVRNADVRELTGEADPNIHGELTASLSLEGAWNDPAARRGRGDVVVAGRQLYRIPLMLGLMQVTNLALPIGQPFTSATAHYTVDGQRVNFEQMELKANSMSMTGSGYLDFRTKQVRMALTTDNPGGFKIPFLSDLWQGARQELFRINVEGTVQDPKVQPTSMGVITTTIDQVFKGDGPRK